MAPMTKQGAPLEPDDAPLIDPGRNLGLRLLGLLGALSFLMLGLATVLIPLLQSAPPPPLPASPSRPTA